MFVRGFCIRRANKGGTAGRRPVLYRKGQAFFCLPALRGRQTSRVSRSVEQPPAGGAGSAYGDSPYGDNSGAQQSSGPAHDNVVDADFEVVDDDK